MLNNDLILVTQRQEVQRHFEEAAENVFDCEKLLLKISENSQEITCGGVQLP